MVFLLNISRQILLYLFVRAAYGRGLLAGGGLIHSLNKQGTTPYLLLLFIRQNNLFAGPSIPL